ncbi:MAG: arylsulfatase [Cyclobacteriaceae bacterium]|nr:MAG: arylsulfatase [Cyclobacteriaceae bacterium]
MMLRPLTIGICLVYLVGFTACDIKKRAAHSQPEKPNIILIMADDLGAETLASYGGESYHTPNINKLSESGMQFENCYSTPLCTPSRVQIMTGKYNFRNYIGFGLLDAEQRTFAHALKDEGYNTLIAGKWQLYGNERQQQLAAGRTGTLPGAAGFDAFSLWQVKDRGWRYKTPTVETSNEGLITLESGYGPDVFVDFIQAFITENKEQPFFVYYPMCLVHDPFLPTPESPEFAAYDPPQNINDTTYFADMMTYMDQLVGRIISKVDELGIREKTLIIFTGDNGTDRKVISTWRGQKIKGEKGFPTKRGTHVPLIANWQGTIKPGQRNENLIDFTDFFPTILEVAGKDPTADQSLDGFSFFPQLLNQPAKTREWVFCHYDPRWGNFPKTRYVHNVEWKLYEDGTVVNIVKDPEEKNRLRIEDLSTDQQEIILNFQGVLSNMVNR